MQEILVGFINEFLPDLIYIITLALFGYIGNLARNIFPIAVKWFKAHTSVAQQNLIEQLGKKAFTYAETIFKEKKGSEKLHEAINFFQKHLDSNGLTGVNLSYTMVRNAVEQAWLADKSLRTFDVKTVMDELEVEEIKSEVKDDTKNEITESTNELLENNEVEVK